MRRTTTFWILAFLITAASAIYQRMTGPSYPVRGKVKVDGAEIAYRLPRSQGDGDPEVRVAVPNKAVQATLGWKRFKTNDTWTYRAMRRDGENLVGMLPHQPPAGKLMYRVVLQRDMERVSVHGEPVVIRFRGEVPAAVLVIHIFCMFVGMLLSTRAGLEFFQAVPKCHWMAAATVVLLTVGGLILGPVVQKYAFGAYWTGWPFGTDLTDNKTAVAWLAWVIVWWRTRAHPAAGAWALAAAVVTLVVFGIPHSMFGSELKYN